MMKMNKIKFTIWVCICFLPLLLKAGNPDRQGESGAGELLLIPWAKSAGMNNIATSMIQGTESMRLNVAGLTGVHSTEVALAHARYLVGTDINMNARSEEHTSELQS